MMTQSWPWVGKIVVENHRNWIMLIQVKGPRFYVNQLFTIPELKNQELTAKFVEIFNFFTYNKTVNSSYL